jgi:hypothetical protein
VDSNITFLQQWLKQWAYRAVIRNLEDKLPIHMSILGGIPGFQRSCPEQLRRLLVERLKVSNKHFSQRKGNALREGEGDGAPRSATKAKAVDDEKQQG